MTLSTIAVRLRRLGRGVVRAFRLSPQEIMSTMHAFVIMVLVESLVRSVALPRLSHALGCGLSLDASVPGAKRLPLKELSPKARRQVRCTRRVARVWPFADGPCLRSALVAGHLLRDLDPSIRLGLLDTGEQMYAHAWIEIDGRPLEHVAAFETFQYDPGGTVSEPDRESIG